MIQPFLQGVLPRVEAEAYARRATRVGRSLARALFVAAWGTLAFATVDHVSPLSRAWRLSAWGGACAATVAYLLLALVVRLRPLDLRRVSRSIERSLGLGAESLQTLVLHHLKPAPGLSEAMLSELAWEVAAKFEGKPRLLRRSRKRWIWLPAVMGATGVAGFAVWDSTSVLRVAVPWQERESTTGPKVRVAPGDVDLPQGRSMDVTASVENTPGPAYLELSRDEVQWVSLEMSPRGASAYVSHLPPVDRDLFYRVRAGGTRSNTYAVRVTVAPLPTTRATEGPAMPTTRDEAALRAYLQRLEGHP